MISSILNRSTHNKINTKSFKDRQKIITDRMQIANKFVHFVTKIGSQQAISIMTDSNKNHTHYLDVSSNNIFQPIKTSCGNYGISLKHIKYIKTELIKPLTLIITQSRNTEIFPNKITISKFIPILKKIMKQISTIIDQYPYYQLFPK